MGERVTQAELARRFEVSRQAINDLVTRGVLSTGHDGLIDIDDARRAIAMSVHPKGKTAGAVSDVPFPPAKSDIDKVKADPEMSFHIAKTMRELAEAKMAGLKLRQMQDELAPRIELDRQMRTAIVQAREFLLRETPRLAVLMEGQNRARREALLREAFEKFLHRLASWQTADIEQDEDNADAQ